MRKQETDSERRKREHWESEKVTELLNRPDPHPEASTSRTIRLSIYPQERFSLRWILLYAQCRHAGVACVYSSSLYASRRSVEWLKTTYEAHYLRDAPFEFDQALMWLAHRYYLAQHKKQHRAAQRATRKEKQAALCLK